MLVAARFGLSELQALQEIDHRLVVRKTARTGRLLMNSPTICSTPGKSGGRPDTTAPKSTSGLPLYLLSSTLQTPCTTALTVNRHSRAIARTRAAVPGSNATRRSAYGSCPGGTSVGVSSATGVGTANPRRYDRQNCSASSRGSVESRSR